MIEGVLLLLLAIINNVEAHGPAPNGVLGEPQIFCGPEGIHVLVRTQGPFRGRLFVAEEADRPECIHSYVDSESPGNSAEFHLKFGACNMRRQRTLSPRGVSFSFVLVTSFHSTFLTGADRAFNVRCFFVEAIKGVESQLEVNQLVTEVVQQEFTLPQCNYHLRQSSSDRSALRFASVGDSVTHVWECDSSAAWLYGLLIHSCYVDDGRGNKFELVDQRGCATDKVLLGDIVYEANGVNAFVNSHVFKYADRVQLFFTCTVQLCFKEDGGCEGITPPNCGGPSRPKSPEKKFVNHASAESSERPEVDRTAAFKSVQERQRAAQALFKSIPRRVFVPPPPPKLTPRLKDDPDTSVFEKLIKDAAAVELNETMFELNETIAKGGRSRSSRDALNFMETDLSAELMVMPLDEIDGAGKDKPRDVISTLPYISRANNGVCISRVGVFSIVTFLVVILFGTAVGSIYLYNRKKNSELISRTRKIYLTE
ncbi:unnamed protein product [Bursaphelenchus xylophilus]|uniref:(pine wood nematode) hypothetical protein n=1 Tax=Bursaphelenchus xylophilus TaxID=6326 RepID=A0A1I7SBU8_BURXY|nr:unnamed protein product [Bursaphelenchus xylophilus]CAG9113008.1 unnamed protein product [Bursaphelenchus xylophilus]